MCDAQLLRSLRNRFSAPGRCRLNLNGVSDVFAGIYAPHISSSFNRSSLDKIFFPIEQFVGGICVTVKRCCRRRAGNYTKYPRNDIVTVLPSRTNQRTVKNFALSIIFRNPDDTHLNQSSEYQWQDWSYSMK